MAFFKRKLAVYLINLEHSLARAEEMATNLAEAIDLLAWLRSVGWREARVTCSVDGQSQSWTGPIEDLVSRLQQQAAG